MEQAKPMHEALQKNFASRLENVGGIETFTGPSRPQLMVGDAAQIVKPTGQSESRIDYKKSTTPLARMVFTTTFVVDSGGRLGKPRLKDYIQKIQQSTSSGSIAYEDVESPEV